jgi:flagellar protein FliT
MNRLIPLLELTEKLHDILKQKMEPKHRDVLISQVNKLIEERGFQLDKLTPPYSEEEKTTGQTIIQLNQIIEREMLALFNDLKSEMKQVKKQKHSNRKYRNPYATMQASDGIFLDRKN